MPDVNNFDVLKRMGEVSGDKLQLAPIGNIISARKVKAGTQITIGVAGDRVTDILGGRIVGGLILADKDEFNRVKAILAAEVPNA